MPGQQQNIILKQQTKNAETQLICCRGASCGRAVLSSEAVHTQCPPGVSQRKLKASLSAL